MRLDCGSLIEGSNRLFTDVAYSADIISLKVPKMGGLYWTRKIADLCQSAGIPNLVGATLGPCIIDLVHTHLACSHPNVTSFACEIGESQRMVPDIVSGMMIRNGEAYPSEAPGLGASITAEFPADSSFNARPHR